MKKIFSLLFLLTILQTTHTNELSPGIPVVISEDNKDQLHPEIKAFIEKNNGKGVLSVTEDNKVKVTNENGDFILIDDQNLAEALKCCIELGQKSLEDSVEKSTSRN